MPCLCNVGQQCVACDKRGERDGVFPDPEIPGSAWCYGHAQLLHEQKVAIWQERVEAQETKERNAAP